MSDAIKAAAEEHYPDGEFTTVGVNAALREAFEMGALWQAFRDGDEHHTMDELTYPRSALREHKRGAFVAGAEWQHEQGAARASWDSLHEQWRTFLHHHPAGAYYPVGQLDGDCAECHVPWPCAPAAAALGVEVTP